METVYQATPTASIMHRDDSFIRLIMGPVGSGKSVACCWEIFQRACKQKINKEGIRSSRWAIIRNTYKELIDTTIRTWQEWFPPEIGYFNKQFLVYKLTFRLPDKTVVELEVLFRALDKPDDIRKLLSLELTGAWINEAREIRKTVLDMLMTRVGRYPSRRNLKDYWHGIILDTNPPDSDHWIYKFFEEIKPPTWKLFRQPSGLSPKAENRDNLPSTYYEQMIPGKTQEWINVYVHGKYGYVSDGKAVFENFNDDVHVAADNLKSNPDEILYVGIDFGLTPACVFCQIINGQWQVLDEITTEDMGTLNFSYLLNKKLRKDYSNYVIQIYGDPAGAQRAQTDEQTPFDILAAQKIFAVPAPTNDFEIRVETITKKLGMMTFSGQPAFIVSPKARMLRKGMGGGYKYRRMQVVGDDRFKDVPDKTIYSHVCEALQYAMLGAGEGASLLGSTDNWEESVNGY